MQRRPRPLHFGKDIVKKTLIRRGPAFPFFLEALSAVETSVKPMFGCHAIYVGAKIVAILRDREDFLVDNGIWVALEDVNKAAIKALFPELRDLNLFGGGPTLWQNLPKTSLQFEAEALRLAEMISHKDPRIGKMPVRKGRLVKRKAVPSLVPEEADGKLESADDEVPVRMGSSSSAKKSASTSTPSSGSQSKKAAKSSVKANSPKTGIGSVKTSSKATAGSAKKVVRKRST